MLRFLALSCAFLHAKGANIIDGFVSNIIETFHSKAPAIIYEERAPEICMSSLWVLCVTTNSETEGHKLADHFTLPNVRHKHDILLFLGGSNQIELVTELDRRAFALFTLDNPVLMPAHYASSVRLWLDSNIIFFEEDGPSSYKLVDIFAVKSGPPIRMDIGKWNYDHGFHFMKSMNRWDRRRDLKGTVFLNALATSKQMLS